jgi:2-methylisocitrate lyase-like PEP mutase family enzyme
LVLPNPWNAGSAKILTALGFEALATTSAGFAFSIGKEDITTQLSRDGILANAKEILDSTPLPVSADLQDGFGPSPETCAATIRLAASTGLAGGSIEDATGNPDSPIYDLQLSVERIQAAAEAAHTHHFLLTARAENFLYDRPNLKDTIRRLQSFAEAGADVLYAPGISTLEEIREVCASVPKPVNVLMGFGNATFSVDRLAAVGVKRISVGGSLARAAFGAFERAASEIKDKGTFTYAKEAISHKDMTAYMTNPKS